MSASFFNKRIDTWRESQLLTVLLKVSPLHLSEYPAFQFRPNMSIALSSNPSSPLPGIQPEQEKLILLQLTADLHLVQNRLGTAQEQPDDCLRAQELGHNIRNKLHVLQTLDSLGLIELPAYFKDMKPPARVLVRAG